MYSSSSPYFLRDAFRATISLACESFFEALFVYTDIVLEAILFVCFDSETLFEDKGCERSFDMIEV